MTKVSEFHDRSVDQLNEDLVKLKKEQFNLRFQRASGQLENTARVREVRRDIARLKTVAALKRAGELQSAGATVADKPRRALRARSAAKPKARSKAKSRSKPKSKS